MIEQDTVKLLRECDAGTKMGISAIGDVLPHVHSERLKGTLTESMEKHERLESELEGLLARYRDDGKEPSPMAKGMSAVKTNVKLMMKDSDATVADLITDGCDMGVKSLSRYLNQYAAADEQSKNIAKRLIGLEESLGVAMRDYL